jgi:Tfp pilus assembly PilM family ATPase
VQSETSIETLAAQPCKAMKIAAGVDEKLLTANMPSLELSCGLALSKVPAF